MLEKFDFLNTELGLEYCAEDEEVYLEVLEGYVEEDRRDELVNHYEQSNWPEYRVVVHAVKSTSLTIGAEDLSAKAKALEMAAADGDEAFIKANHDELIEEYGELLDKISEAL